MGRTKEKITAVILCIAMISVLCMACAKQTDAVNTGDDSMNNEEKADTKAADSKEGDIEASGEIQNSNEAQDINEEKQPGDEQKNEDTGKEEAGENNAPAKPEYIEEETLTGRHLPEENDPDWETGKKSGLLEDFEKYFNFDQKTYKQAVENCGNLELVKYRSKVFQAEREAYVYTPYGYDETKEYPVIYMIHGLGCTCSQWADMGAARILDFMIANEQVVPCIAVLPSVVPAQGLDDNSFSSANINAFKMFDNEFKIDLVPYIREHYSISEKREDTAVCGLSMGGMEALKLGFGNLDIFAYIGSYSAAPTLDLSVLKADGEFKPELVLICTGDKDSTVQGNPALYHDELEKNGIDSIWYLHPGGAHEARVWTLALINFLKRIF